MSRKYRQEEEKAKQLSSELQEEEDKLKLQKERIFGPIVWKRLAYGIRIQDLHAMYFEPLLDIIEEHYVTENVVFRNTRFLEDDKSVKSYNEKLIHTMKDRVSIIAIDEENDEIAGALILKAVKKCDYGRVFSRVMLSDGVIYQSVKGGVVLSQ
ncbi:unnamed protein product [Acanthoscelides obtectus]|uniref:Uncharacterized protein n=1 Tax=Acanthoscelides obtectus TaxID=200917 RepID=A0A9P0PN66_ACAOB|nr:unnamed protein product [Acanthoscelides obtectus]CAK1684283.1 hypothetical protein AOBTE_LOCUS34775 [Acanthoscelides obtectus]